jgi:integrase
MISNHTARRTFATLAYLHSDLEVRDLMRFFGHQKKSTFKRYVQVQRPIDSQKIMNIFFETLRRVS